MTPCRRTGLLITILLGSLLGGGLFLGGAATTPDGSAKTPVLTGNPLPVFTDAGGFGTSTPAGRGGKIIKVTTLAASGPGSLKEALETSGPRLIVFEVGGTIDWSSHGPYVTVAEPFITIAGQTAPSPGITLTGAGLRIVTQDVLLQHLRFRVNARGYEGIRDGIMVLGGAERVVIDHVSIAGASNEGFVTWKSPHNVTLSNSIISQNNVGERHGVLLGDLSQNIALIGNLISENPGRNPLIKGGTTIALINNVILSPGSGTPCVITDDYNHGPSAVSLIGNFFQQGPDTKTGDGSWMISTNRTVKAGTRIYQQGNLYQDQSHRPLPFLSNHAQSFTVPDSPLPLPGVGISATDAVVRALQQAGARPAERDSIDWRAAEQLLQMTGLAPQGSRDAGPPPLQTQSRRPLPLPADPHGDEDGNGYTNIEELLQRMAAAVEGRP